MSCSGQPDGTVCPGSDDPRQGERCSGGACIGTYVATSGNDSNPGTRAQPRRTIAAGIAQATALGAHAATPKPVPVIVGAGVYAESLILPDQIDLQGSYDAAWVRNAAAHSSRIDSDALGVRFSLATMTRSSSKMSGFTVVSPTGPSSRAILVSNGARPTLEDLEVRSGDATDLGPGSTVALVVEGPTSRPLISRSALTSGNAGTFGYETPDYSDAFSAAVFVTNGGSIEMDKSSATSGDSNERPAAVSCSGGCAGSTFTDVTLRSPKGAALLLYRGDYSGLTVTRALLEGHFGVRASDCTAGGIAVLQTTVRGLTRYTGTPDGSRVGTGVAVLAGCSVEIRRSQIIGAYDGAPTNAIGVRCEGTGCTLIDNEIWGVGPAVLSSGVTIGVNSSAPLRLERNVIRGGSCGTTNEGFGLESAGVRGHNRSATAENNVIVAGDCLAAIGLDLNGPGKVVVNNHIEAVGRMGGAASGVSFNHYTSAPSDPIGVFLNNTILAGSGSTEAVFAEGGNAGRRAELRNNNLYGGAALYSRDGMAVQSIGELNALAGGGNISANPQVTADWHLQPTSPNRGAGAAAAGAVLAPVTDRDGDPRPAPAGTNPDIGPDERD